MNLIKKLFWPKRDFVRVFYDYEEDSVNEFLGEVNKSGGKVIKLDDISYSENHSSIQEKGYQTNEYAQVIESTTQGKLVIHYRCFEKINYLNGKEREIQERAEQQKVKYLKRSSKDNVKKLKEDYLNQQEKKRMPKTIGENNRNYTLSNKSSSYVPPGDADDLPF